MDNGTQMGVLVRLEGDRMLAAVLLPRGRVVGAQHRVDLRGGQREVGVSSGDSNPLSGYVRALHDVLPPERSARAERRILVVHWTTGSQPARVLAVLDVPPGAETLADVGSFSDLWGLSPMPRQP